MVFESAPVVAPVPARAAPLVQPSFIPSTTNISTYPMDDELNVNPHPIRPPSPIPGSASDHFQPITSQSSSSASSLSSPIIHHSIIASITPTARAVPYPTRPPRMSHTAKPKRPRAPSSASYTTTSCPVPSSPHTESSTRPTTSSSSPGMPSPAYPACFYPTPLPSPPRQSILPARSSLVWPPPVAEDTGKMDVEQNEDVVSEREEGQDAAHASVRLPPHLNRSMSQDQPHHALDAETLPSFHDLLESLHEPETAAASTAPLPDDVVEQEIERTVTPMRLMFTPVSNSTMASAMQGLDVGRLAEEVDDVMDTRSW